jgi:hypothetical protein
MDFENKHKQVEKDLQKNLKKIQELEKILDQKEKKY